MSLYMRFREGPMELQSRSICRFYQRGTCRFGNRCRNIHGEIEHTKTTGENINTPEKYQNKDNFMQKKESLLLSTAASSVSPSEPENELQTELGPSTSSTKLDATQSLNKTCGICFDTIVEKKDRREQIFGILPNCNHCFCFSCIRKWRQSKEFDFDVSKACPECRITSNYVYPSKIWYEIKEEKDSFITNENNRKQKFDCKYFKKGTGTCPFGNTCLYLHALPNGKKMDVGPPRPRRRRTSNIDQELVHEILYWLNDDDDLEDEDDDNDFDLDLDDPTIAMQYYDHDDIRRYIAINRLMNPSSDTESDDYDFPLFL